MPGETHFLPLLWGYCCGFYLIHHRAPSCLKTLEVNSWLEIGTPLTQCGQIASCEQWTVKLSRSPFLHWPPGRLEEVSDSLRHWCLVLFYPYLSLLLYLFCCSETCIFFCHVLHTFFWNTLKFFLEKGGPNHRSIDFCCEGQSDFSQPGSSSQMPSVLTTQFCLSHVKENANHPETKECGYVPIKLCMWTRTCEFHIVFTFYEMVFGWLIVNIKKTLKFLYRQSKNSWLVWCGL